MSRAFASFLDLYGLRRLGFNLLTAGLGVYSEVPVRFALRWMVSYSLKRFWYGLRTRCCSAGFAGSGACGVYGLCQNLLHRSFFLSSWVDTLYTLWDNIPHYKTESVNFWGLMNSEPSFGIVEVRKNSTMARTLNPALRTQGSERLTVPPEIREFGLQ